MFIFIPIKDALSNKVGTWTSIGTAYGTDSVAYNASNYSEILIAGNSGNVCESVVIPTGILSSTELIYAVYESGSIFLYFHVSNASVRATTSSGRTAAFGLYGR